MESSVYFCFYDLSIGEQEVIYTLLAKTFYVIEEKLSFDDMESQLPNFLSITDYSITFIKLIFPFKFDNYLFQIIPIEHWNSIKNIIKEIKHRRGNKPVICIFKFKDNTNQTDFNIIFSIMKKLYKKENFDKIVLISGDGDYRKLEDFLVEEERFAKILFPNKNNASSLYKKI